MNIINSFPIGERKRDEDFSCSADKSKKKQSTSELRQIDSISWKLVIQKKKEKEKRQESSYSLLRMPIRRLIDWLSLG